MKKRPFHRNIRVIVIADVVMLVVIGMCLLLTEKPEQPKQLKVTAKDYDTVELQWEKTEDATSYGIFRSEDGKSYECVDYTADNCYDDENLVTGKNYYYLVSSRNALARSKLNKKQAISVATELEAPTLSVDTSKGEIDLTFTKSNGAIGYKIIRNGEEIADIRETAYTDSESEKDKALSYQVKAYRYKKNPVYSTVSNTVKAKLNTIKNFTIETDNNDLIFKWDVGKAYTTFKLYNGDTVLTETTDGIYKLSEYNLSETMDIRLEGTTNDGKKKSPQLVKKIQVVEEPMDNKAAIDAACDWGVEIANDDSFTYGTGDRAHRCGCYFCGTNTGPRQNRKGKSLVNGHSYEKTYCCNPFVHACFAHGAGDQKMLKACQAGDSVDMAEKSYTKFGNWQRVSKPSMENLQRGDVLVCKSHVMLYIGDGQIVHAGRSGWDASSITVAKCSSYYGMVKFVMRYTGNGDGIVRVVKEVD